MSFDLTLFNILHALAGRSGVLDGLIVFLAQYLPYLLIIGVFLFLYIEKGWKRKVFTFLSLFIGVIVARGVVVEAIRFFYDRPRPFRILDITSLLSNSSPAFPSGHASLFFLASFVIFYFNRRWGWWFLGLSFVNGLARVAAGLHWPSDIVGGILVGALSFGIVYLLLRRYEPARIPRGSLQNR